jgi:hypothetical protein
MARNFSHAKRSARAVSEARVEFLSITGDELKAGEAPQRFTFRCVGHNRGRHPALEQMNCGNLLIANSGHGIKRDGQGQNGGRPQWDWDGNREAPTFSPSIHCEKHCGWHGYIRGGRCVNTAGQDEP